MALGLFAADAQAQAPAQDIKTGEPVVVVDLSGGSDAQRDALVSGLRTDRRILIDDESLTFATVASGPAAADPGAQELAEAQAAFGKLDCATAKTKSEAAISKALAGQSVKQARAKLTSAEVYLFRCAEQAGQTALAHASAVRLSHLGYAAPPPGISPSSWAAHAAVDASTNISTRSVTITADQEGAEVWVDYLLVGTSPVTVLSPPGPHVIGVVSNKRRAAVVTDSDSVELKLPAAPVVSTSSDRAIIERWKSQKRPPRSSEIGKLLKLKKRRVALILSDNGQVYIWTVPKGSRFARRVAAAPAGKPAYIARLVMDWVLAEDGAGIDPSVPLLREESGGAKASKKDRSWWVYAAVVGAAVIGGGLIIANEFSTDKQRIELEIP